MAEVQSLSIVDIPWSDEEIEVWIEKRFGPNSPFNRQLIKDLISDVLTRAILRSVHT